MTEDKNPESNESHEEPKVKAETVKEESQEKPVEAVEETAPPVPTDDQPVVEAPAPTPAENQPVAGIPAPTPAEGQPVVEIPAPTPVAPPVTETAVAIPVQAQPLASPVPAVGIPQPQAPIPPKQKSSLRGSIFAGVISGLLVALLSIPVALLVVGVKDGKTTSTSDSSSKKNPALTSKSGQADPVAVAEKVVPSVVNVAITQKISNPFMGDQTSSGNGSGVIIKEDGYILTNNHVIANADSITVTVGNEDLPAKLVGTDPSSDLAVLKIDKKGLPVIEVGDSSTVKVGEWVMAVGSPFGLEKSVTSGIVSALRRAETMEAETGISIYSNMIQIDAAINPGNSGGALVNSNGELIGINTLIQSTSGSSAGIGFAIPSSYAMEIADQLMKTGSASHPFLGVSLMTIDESTAQQYGLSVKEGAYVAEVAAGSPAEQAGVKKGDVIVEFGGEKIKSADDLILNLRTHKTGEKTSLTVVRDKAEKKLEIKIGSDAKKG